MPQSSAMENEKFMICAELTSGYLERDVFVALEAENDTGAMRMLCDNFNRFVNNLSFFHAEGADFIGPEPSLLTFTSGQSMGDVQCANVTILDDSILRGQRNLSIRLRNHGGNSSGVEIDDNTASVDVTIIESDDGKNLIPLTVAVAIQKKCYQ